MAAPASLPPLLAVSNGEVILIVVFVALPVAAIAFATVGPALRQLGKGRFAVQYESDLDQKPAAEQDTAAAKEVREAEIRQMLEAKAYRQESRGEQPLDVDEELARLTEERAPSSLAGDKQLVEEVRQLVVARNERRARRGEDPLDVDEEIERQLRELENLGQ